MACHALLWRMAGYNIEVEVVGEGDTIEITRGNNWYMAIHNITFHAMYSHGLAWHGMPW